MLVTIEQNKRNPDNHLAFLEVQTKRFGKVRLPAFFDRNAPMPELGQAVVMITGVLSHLDQNKNMRLLSVPKCLFVRVVTFDDLKVNIKGFETHGSQCYTTSAAINVRDRNDKYDITPGRLMPHLVDIHNEARHPDKPRLPLIGGVGYIEFNSEHRKYRLAGLDDFSMLVFTRGLEECGYDENDAD